MDLNAATCWILTTQNFQVGENEDLLPKMIGQYPTNTAFAADQQRLHTNIEHYSSSRRDIKGDRREEGGGAGVCPPKA